MSWTPGTTLLILRNTHAWADFTSASSASSTWRARLFSGDTWWVIVWCRSQRGSINKHYRLENCSCVFMIFFLHKSLIIGFFGFDRQSVCGSILQEMRCTEKELYLFLRLTAKRIRSDLNILFKKKNYFYFLLFSFQSLQFIHEEIFFIFMYIYKPFFCRFTARTCVYLPNFSWTTKHCTTTWNLFSSMSWLKPTTPAAI